MTQYINKDKAIELIEKAVDEPAPSHDQQCPWEDGYWGGLYKAVSIIENLEVKEVDLEKELDSMLIPELKLHKALPSLFDVAKHFFELGLKAQKGE